MTFSIRGHLVQFSRDGVIVGTHSYREITVGEPILVEDSANVEGRLDARVEGWNGLNLCRICATRESAVDQSALADEASKLASALGLGSSGGKPDSLQDEAARLEDDIRRWEAQQRLIAAQRQREEDERRRLAAEAAAARYQDDSFAYDESQQTSSGQGSSLVGDVLGLAGTLYMQRKLGVAAPVTPSAQGAGSDACGYDTQMRVARIMEESERDQVRIRSSGGSICASARANAEAMRRAETAAGACASAAAQARDLRIQYENQARTICAR